MNYHVKKDAPQAFAFDVGGIVGNLVSPELVTTPVDVVDVRDADRQPDFRQDGIEFVDQASQVRDFESDDDWRTLYDRELITLLMDRLGAVEVIVFDHTIRIDGPDAPRRPARNVHNDYNETGARSRLVDLVGDERAQRFEMAGYGFVNVWRPVASVIASSPLGFVRPDSMSPDDWIDIDLIYPDRRGQILGVAANRTHDWFYRSRMSPDEAVIFNIHDGGGRPHLAHSALDLPDDAYATHPRRSIESRTLVRYS